MAERINELFMKKLIIVMVVALVMPVLIHAQENDNISQARKDNLIEILNYRYKGGFYSFERKFNKIVEYPEMAKANCVVGVSLISIKVDCNGKIEDLRIKTPLGYGIDQEISKFFNSTEGEWNTCKEEKYTKFDLAIQFILTGTDTKTGDALLVKEAKNPGFLCNPDEYYIKKINKYMEKKKWKKVIPYLDVMIRRDPYNTLYFDMKRLAVNGGEEPK